MKKVFIILLIVMLLSACEKSEIRNIQEVVSTYKEQLDSIVESDQASALTQSVRLLSETQDTVTQTREDFMSIYNQMRHNANEVHLEEHLSIYQTMLDDTLTYIEENHITQLTFEFTVELNGFGVVDATLEYTQEGFLVFNFALVQNELSTMYVGVKIGYEHDDFRINQFVALQNGEDLEEGYFEYFEFLDQHYIINVRYTNDDQGVQNYWYQYINQNDNMYYEISTGVEADEESGFSGYTISWYNPTTNIRSTLGIDQDEIITSYVEFFNEHAIYFTYSNYPYEGISLAWQMCEVTGWDYAIFPVNYGASYPDTGIYKNDVKIESFAKYNIYLNEQAAHARMEIDLGEQNITDELLNLNVYGLQFNYTEITTTYLNTMIDGVYDESKYLAQFKGIDFTSKALVSALYDVVDSDIKP